MKKYHFSFFYKNLDPKSQARYLLARSGRVERKIGASDFGWIFRRFGFPVDFYCWLQLNQFIKNTQNLRPGLGNSVNITGSQTFRIDRNDQSSFAVS